MSSSIYSIDYYANTTKSFISKRATLAKLIFLLIVVFSIVISKSIYALLLIFFAIIILIIAARLPVFKILKWSLIPAFFALLFAVSQLKYGLVPLQTIFRAVDAALLMLLIICTTPYPAIFSAFNKLSPILASVFFMTYRSIFLIVNEVQIKTKMMKIRGGYSAGFIKTLKNIGSLIARLFINAIEKSEKIYNLLNIRGYQGTMFSRATYYSFGFLDLVFIIIGIIIFAATIKL